MTKEQLETLHKDVESGLVMIVETEHYKQLEAENKQQAEFLSLAKEQMDAYQAENERYEEALRRIDVWARAYPLKVFPKPDLKKAHQVLKAAGMTLDAISADAMRHVLSGVKDIVKQALDERKGG